MIIKENILLSEYTTIKLGGRAKYFIECDSESSVTEALKFAREKNARIQVLSGGSNIIFPDNGFDGVILKMNIKGVSVKNENEDHFITSGAGESWDDFVLYCIENEFAGAECLSGIPGSVGAVPVQNVGAYGQEVADIIHSVRTVDRDTYEIKVFGNEDCKFGYRNSRFKSGESDIKDKYIITEVVFKMKKNTEPVIRYPELQKYISAMTDLSSLKPGKEKLFFIRNAVLALRKKKSMIIDKDDPDSVSCGSFFTNPVLNSTEFKILKSKTDDLNLILPFYETPDPGTEKKKYKIPAAWLIEQSGFVKGYNRNGAGISANHSLAIVNRGGKTSDVISLSEEIIETVKNKFGVMLVNEPVIVS